MLVQQSLKNIDPSDGFFFALASSSNALCSYGHTQFSFFDMTKNNLVIHISYS